MKKKENSKLPENRENLNAENHVPQNEGKNIVKDSTFTQNRENLNADQYFPPSEEKVVTEILFPQSGNIVIRKIIFPISSMDDPKVIVENPDICIEPSMLFYDSKKIVVSKILYDGKEEKVLFEILITESGKIVMRGIDYLKPNGNETMNIFYPGSNVVVKTDVLFSSGQMIETKRILFPASQNN